MPFENRIDFRGDEPKSQLPATDDRPGVVEPTIDYVLEERPRSRSTRSLSSYPERVRWPKLAQAGKRQPPSRAKKDRQVGAPSARASAECRGGSAVRNRRFGSEPSRRESILTRLAVWNDLQWSVSSADNILCLFVQRLSSETASVLSHVFATVILFALDLAHAKRRPLLMGQLRRTGRNDYTPRRSCRSRCGRAPSPPPRRGSSCVLLPNPGRTI